MKLSIATVFLVFIGIACNSLDEKGKTSDNDMDALVGEWNNLFLRVDIRSKNNSDTNEVFEVDREHWEEILKIKPIRTFFRIDSTWNSAHYDLQDSLVYNPSGKWQVASNKLTMFQMLPVADTTTYIFDVKNDTASFECMLDWDMDGIKDDKYIGRQARAGK